MPSASLSIGPPSRNRKMAEQVGEYTMFALSCAPWNACANHPARVVSQDPSVENPCFVSCFLAVSTSRASDVQPYHTAGFPQTERTVENPCFDTDDSAMISFSAYECSTDNPPCGKPLLRLSRSRMIKCLRMRISNRLQQRLSHRAKAGFPQPLFRYPSTRPLLRTVTCDDDCPVATIAERKWSPW